MSISIPSPVVPPIKGDTVIFGVVEPKPVDPIITIEPGIYIKNLGGIRIEDDVLVTKDGYKILTKASKKLIKITE